MQVFTVPFEFRAGVEWAEVLEYLDLNFFMVLVLGLEFFCWYLDLDLNFGQSTWTDL